MSAGLLCIYYKLPTSCHAELTRAVVGFQEELVAAWPGLVCELLQRPRPIDGIETWMETYRHPSAALDALAEAIARMAASRPALPRPRHAEIFVDVARDE